MASTNPTKHVYLQGKAKWARLLTPSKFNRYSIDLYMDQENVEKFRELKVKNHLKKDEDGYYVTFGRPTEILRKGQKVGLAPPVVVDKHGSPIPGVHVGNSSDVTIDLEYYSYATPKGDRDWACRLARVRVDSLVPFDPNSDLAKIDMPDHIALSNQPAPIAF